MGRPVLGDSKCRLSTGKRRRHGAGPGRPGPPPSRAPERRSFVCHAHRHQLGTPRGLGDRRLRLHRGRRRRNASHRLQLQRLGGRHGRGPLRVLGWGRLADGDNVHRLGVPYLHRPGSERRPPHQLLRSVVAHLRHILRTQAGKHLAGRGGRSLRPVTPGPRRRLRQYAQHRVRWGRAPGLHGLLRIPHRAGDMVNQLRLPLPGQRRLRGPGFDQRRAPEFL